MDHLDRGDPHALHPGHPRRAHQQFPEVEAGGGVAVVADADPRHHDLALVLLHAAAHLVEDRRGRPRAGAPPHGRDDAVGAVAVTAVLDLHEPPRAGPRPGVLRRPGGAPERDLVLEVDARAALSVARPARRRHPHGDLLGGAGEGLHAGVDLLELGRAQVDRAAGHVHLARGLQRAAHRLARLRLRLAGDAAGVDHVQLGLLLGHLFVARLAAAGGGPASRRPGRPCSRGT